MADPLGIIKAGKKVVKPITDEVGKIADATAQRQYPNADQTPIKTMRNQGDIPTNTVQSSPNNLRNKAKGLLKKVGF